MFTAGAYAEKQPSPGEQLKAVQKDVADAEAAYRAAYKAKAPDPLGNDPELGKLRQVFRQKQRAGFDAAIAIARADPKSVVGFNALEWVLLNTSSYDLPVGTVAFSLLTEHHAVNPKIGKAVALLAYYNLPYDFSNFKKGDDPITIPFSPQAVALLKAVSEQNPDRTARGHAVYGLAGIAMDEFKKAESRRKANTEKLALAAEREFDTVIKDYGDCAYFRAWGAASAKPTLGDNAKSDLYELRNLRIGKHAPDIEGEDLSGAKFKLSDYRGNVILLVFWASWCGPCMADVPHERELVERFKGRPFVLVGVNGDEKKENAQNVVQTKQIPWRSFYQKDGPSGLIVTAWNVRAWPTVYVIDHKGVISDKYLQHEKLDDPLEKLVTEAETVGKAK
ncbi:MAG TPA: TlpA disulfide reductase family protein [Gemmataceae bacterium]|nr:TlpA disulfide reductase family protein [Gemmataceae bacterium]